MTARIAVVMPVHNCERYLSEAVRSVLCQTFRDFELVVINDGSTDSSGELLSRISDPRLRVIHFPERRGLVHAINYGIRESESELIARMDGDDISLPRRFERQAAFLTEHPEVDVCGTFTVQFGSHSGVRRHPTAPEAVRARMFFGGALDHPSLMMRRAFIERSGLVYDDGYRYAEDLDLLIRAADLGNVSNVPEVLLRYRAHSEQIKFAWREEQSAVFARLLTRQLRLLLSDPAEEAFHVRLVTSRVEERELGRVERWLERLENANAQCRRYEETAFRRELQRIWFYAHARCPTMSVDALRSYFVSPLANIGGIGVLRHARLIGRSLLPGRAAPNRG